MTPPPPSLSRFETGAAVLFGGVDWAAEEHAVSVLDAATERFHRTVTRHTAEGFDRLLEAGHPVVVVKTSAIKRGGRRERPGCCRSFSSTLRGRASWCSSLVLSLGR